MLHGTHYSVVYVSRFHLSEKTRSIFIFLLSEFFIHQDRRPFIIRPKTRTTETINSENNEGIWLCRWNCDVSRKFVAVVIVSVIVFSATVVRHWFLLKIVKIVLHIDMMRALFTISESHLWGWLICKRNIQLIKKGRINDQQNYLSLQNP